MLHKAKLRFIWLSGLLLFVSHYDSRAQDTLWIWTYPSAAEVLVSVNCTVEHNSGQYQYNYILVSDSSSEQSVEGFFVDHSSSITSIETPDEWLGDHSGTRNAVMWGSGDSLADIFPGHQLSGFGMTSTGLPAIFAFYVRGYRYIPPFEFGITPDSTIGGDVFENSYKGRTVAPRTPPTPFNALTFLDTITSYISESRTLGWITNDPTANKYKRLIDTARFHLQANNRGVTKAKLDSVLVNVYPDSAAGTLSSEAYALLRFNTEYLLKKLSEE